MSEGWFKLHRCLLEKAIWQQSTPEQKVILVTLLGMANHSEREWEWKGRQFRAKPGMLVTSLDSIKARCGKGISIQNVRSAITKFKKYDFLTEEVTKTGRLITIINWSFYQENKYDTNKDTNKEVTNDQQSTNKEVTPNKNDKNIKNDNNDKERKEEVQAPFPSPFHEVLFNSFGDVGYKTWFSKADIKEDTELITITVAEGFIKKVIQERYLEQIGLLTVKKISVEVGA